MAGESALFCCPDSHWTLEGQSQRESWVIPIVPSVCLLRQPAIRGIILKLREKVLGGFESAFWSVGFVVVVVVLGGCFFFFFFFAWCQCEGSVSLK